MRGNVVSREMPTLMQRVENRSLGWSDGISLGQCVGSVLLRAFEIGVIIYMCGLAINETVNPFILVFIFVMILINTH